MAIWHVRLAFSCVLELQSVPPDGTWMKLLGMDRFEAVICWFPALVTVTACAGLAWPICSLGKISAIGCARFTSYKDPLASEMYTLVAKNTTPLGCESPVVGNVVWTAP